MSYTRIDPIVSPGVVGSNHVHTVHGTYVVVCVHLLLC